MKWTKENIIGTVWHRDRIDEDGCSCEFTVIEEVDEEVDEGRLLVHLSKWCGDPGGSCTWLGSPDEDYHERLIWNEDGIPAWELLRNPAHDPWYKFMEKHNG